jgi:hypothetical protein
MYDNKRLGFLFVLPFVLGIVLFKLFPFVASLALSFTQYDLIDPPQYTGLQNYRELFGDDPLFRQSLGVTLWFATLAVPLRVGFALFVAHVLNFKLRGINFFRSAFYLPSILGGSIFSPWPSGISVSTKARLRYCAGTNSSRRIANSRSSTSWSSTSHGRICCSTMLKRARSTSICGFMTGAGYRGNSLRDSELAIIA